MIDRFADTLWADGYSAASMKTQTERIWEMTIGFNDEDMGDIRTLLNFLQHKGGTFFQIWYICPRAGSESVVWI